MPIISHDVAYAAATLRAGGIVAFATETVYGLGADARSDAAICAVYDLKRRPYTHPLIVHLADFAEAHYWAEAIPDSAYLLADRFMPGALTLLLPRAAGVSAQVTGGSATIGLRCPSHAIAQALLKQLGSGIAAPSANRFGRLSPTCAGHVADEFADAETLLILDGGDCPLGIESTIVGFSEDKPFIVRSGSISDSDIAAVTAMATHRPPVQAPGTLPSHYAPHTPLQLVSAHTLPALATGNVAVLSRHPPAGVTHWRCAPATPHDYARLLYRYLRELDATQCTRLLVEQPPGSQAWDAINDRLKRASYTPA